jgi:hypothetical protein
MTVKILFPSGAVSVSDIINNQLVTKTYYGYTRKQAVALFKKEYK